MCDAHGISVNRRNFGALGLGAVAFAAAPRVVYAADIEALAFFCIDYRLVDDGVKFFDGKVGKNQFDILALAGASLGAVSPKFPSSNSAFWDHVGIAKSLHHIKKVVVLDHRDCGAYKVAFGKDFAAARDAETAQHKGAMEQLKSALAHKHPDLSSEFYLMAHDGTAERVV